MPKYIDEAEIKKFTADHMCEYCHSESQTDCNMACAIIALERYVDSLPAADVVEVVRCRDCKHGELTECGLLCKKFYEYNCDDHDGFCNMGEKKDDGEIH